MGSAIPQPPYEVPDVEHSGSAPPSDPPPPKPERQTTGAGHETTAEQRDRYRRELAVLRPLADRVSTLERDMGRRPDATDPRDEGEGIWTPLYRLQRGLARVEATCDRILTRLDVDAATADRRGGWAARVGWKMIDVLVPALVLAALAYLAGFHR